ncbi:MAG: NAD(P)H-hydrate dehydratase [Bacteriovoracaceae bacterium]|nr:NAD(P)H-hydrate dehydratase [Bacteriovoracaceae bacterium]
MRIVSLEEIKQIEQTTFGPYHILETQIIENVGIRTCEFIKQLINSSDLPKESQVVVFLGSGNNASDGLAAARHLLNSNVNVSAIELFPDKKKSPELILQMKQAKAFGVSILNFTTFLELKSFVAGLPPHCIVVDAIVGTGFRPPLNEYLSHVLTVINQMKATIVSLDIPSGISGLDGQMDSVAIKASHTLAVAVPKLGHFLDMGLTHSGKLTVIDVGFPTNLLCGGDKTLITSLNVAWNLLKRDPLAHKNDFGHTLCIGGSKGLTGAIILAATSAQKMGVGLISVYTWQDCYQELTSKIAPEIMTGVLKATTKDEISHFVSSLSKYNSIVIGPGLGTSKTALEIVRLILLKFMGPVIVDADAINLLDSIKDQKLISKRTAPTVFTPHPGELSKFSGLAKKQLLKTPLEVLKKLSNSLNATIVLKGACSYIQTPSNLSFIYFSPNDGMATAGSGDVLAGILGGVFAQAGTNVDQIVPLSVYLHGKAGENAKQKLDARSMNASDIIDNLASAINQTLK